MWYNQLKTAVLLASLSGILIIMGSYMGGMNGLILFVTISLFLNGVAFFFSDKIVLAMYKAKPLDPQQYSTVYSLVQELAEKDEIPMPKLWYVPMELPNAFATVRGPGSASVGLTEGILNLLDESELRGVLAHELSHIKNRDILINTVAAVFATAIGFVSNFMRQVAYGPRDRNERQRINPLAVLLMIVFLPMAASLIRFSITRTREYIADESGAWLSHDPLALASALQKLHDKSKQMRKWFDPRYAGTAHLFIVSPFSSAQETPPLFKWFGKLFASHPPVEERVERLKQIHQKMLSSYN